MTLDLDKNNVKAKYKSYFLNFVGLKIFLWGDHCSTDSKDQYLNLSMHKGFNVSFGNFFDNNCDLQTIKANCQYSLSNKMAEVLA